MKIDNYLELLQGKTVIKEDPIIFGTVVLGLTLYSMYYAKFHDECKNKNKNIKDPDLKKIKIMECYIEMSKKLIEKVKVDISNKCKIRNFKTEEQKVKCVEKSKLLLKNRLLPDLKKQIDQKNDLIKKYKEKNKK